MTDLGTLPCGFASSALAVNNHGRILGYIATRWPGLFVAVLWTIN
jgi:hypothetical protein